MKEENQKKNVETKEKKTTTKKVVKKDTSKAKKEAPAKKTTPKKTTTAKKKSTPKKETVSEIKKEETKKILERMEIPEIAKEEIKEEKIEKFNPQEEKTIFILRIIAIILAAVLVIVAGVKVFMEAKDNNYSDYWKNKSYLIEKNLAQKTVCNDLESIVNGKEKIVLVTNFTEEEFELEKQIAKLIKEYKLEDKFYVYALEESCKSSALENLQLEKFEQIPAIYYYRNGLLNYKVEREDQKMIEAADFQKLLDIYEFEKGE